MEKLKMETKNILNENIEKVAELFPNCLVETDDGKKIDFDILRQELSEDIVEGVRERYHLDFPGKREAILEANRKTNKTLRPIKEKSIDFDNTKNIYIEGDNLEALKILQESYLGKIKCIYIDPPYNTGNDFVYNDKFSHTETEELKASGRIDEDGNVLISKDINNDSNGRYHSDWLKLMYTRLRVARNLLGDDGFIFISIDDNEQSNLRKICDEIFGEYNCLSNAIWNSISSVLKTSKFIRKEHEYILIYTKERSISNFNKLENTMSFSNIDNDPNGAWFSSNAASPNQKSNVNKFGIKLPNGDICTRNWKFSEKDYLSGKISLYLKDGNVPRLKIYEKDYNKNSKVQSSIFRDLGSITTGKNELKDIFDFIPFDTPKPIDLIKLILTISTGENDIVLDFFSGSATTAHAVMKLNAEDGGNRQYIMVQLPEATAEGSEAHKAGYKTICDIGEERIRRAGKKILEESKNNVGAKLASPLDIGFRVYKVDSSNMKDIYYTPDKIDQNNLLDMVSNVKEDRNAEDLLTQVILNLGLPLDMHIEEKIIKKNKVYFVEQNALVACFDDTIDLEILDEIVKVSPLKICLRESSFEKDQDKINFFERLKKLSPDTEVAII